MSAAGRTLGVPGADHENAEAFGQELKQMGLKAPADSDKETSKDSTVIDALGDTNEDEYNPNSALVLNE
ncbi:hypothetical protein BDY19DRAFT_997540 [Irpex rosettiformis]|uniref:Uncharacterized protein n=1 Tax=Irpex rosettiformis TaxID=378272 RepID=A0ACB8TRS1_9APHY|nr:hypothetical protein BDY19DRAFT_997540 [Irpex rosettiformis]